MYRMFINGYEVPYLPVWWAWTHHLGRFIHETHGRFIIWCS
jgi:hypothetical protein